MLESLRYAESGDSLFELPPLTMPKEFIGEHKTSGGYTKTTPREWTAEEVTWILERKQDGYSNAAIADACGRSEISIQVKLKRLSKVSDSYNFANRNLKYQTNQAFLDLISPDSVADLYAGESWWQGKVKKCLTNDKDERFNTDFHQDALSLLCQLYSSNQKFDVIDLDPYGSAYDCFDLAIKMSKKGIVISFGEWGHKRWKRTDFVKPRYGISTLAEFQTDQKFIEEVQRIASCNKKLAKPLHSIQYGNFLRVYFELTPIKVTSQWETNK